MKITFNEALKTAEEMIISPGCKTKNKGYFTNGRIDRTTLPNGWYAYDIRSGGPKDTFQTIEPMVLVNHAGTFLTQTPLKMNKNDYHSLAHGAGYTFT